MKDRRTYHQHYYQAHRVELCVAQQQYDLGHKKEKALRNRKERAKLKYETIAHYSKGEMKCLHCGIGDIDVLCIDHINGKGNAHRKLVGEGGVEFYRFLRKNNYPNGYQVLCANCNLKKELEKIRKVGL